MSNVIQLRIAPAIAPVQVIASACNVVNLFQAACRSPAAKADGVFAQVNIAARRMGVKPHIALRYAKEAKQDYLNGTRSPARVVADWKAALRLITERVQA
ncbi:hypothetical protein [Lysobacter auxotrophicus]|uniref:Uncharacterized protein n=1 Tax=Lysobacter auxotrophicus TaxID=2992573 RepID=A0ABM8DG35_9GAMM|nr:hypothetical protein [Lysobacter auxotrophicus]BDU17557.1 hypothetical protein LA521A_27580 [Lysobacter auxotrophicus]